MIIAVAIFIAFGMGFILANAIDEKYEQDQEISRLLILDEFRK